METTTETKPRKRPLRVAQVMQYFDIGGIESLVSRLAIRGKEADVESLVIAYLGDGPLRARLEAAGIPTVLLEGGAGLQPARVWRLRQALQAFGADVVHTHHLGPLLYGGLAARSLGIPVVHTEHSVEWADNPRLRRMSAVAGRGATVTAVSSAVAQARQACVRAPVQVIDNGVPVRARDAIVRAEVRAEWNISLDAPAIGCVARLASEKDHAMLLRAFAQVQARRADAQLVLVGDGPERTALETQAAAAGLPVHFLGVRTDVGRQLQGMDVVALASQREGQPLALLEAMGAGLPVVATAVGGVPLLLDGGAGLLVPAGDAEAMANALLQVLEQPGLAQALGTEAQSRVVARYGETAMLGHYLDAWRTASRRPA